MNESGEKDFHLRERIEYFFRIQWRRWWWDTQDQILEAWGDRTVRRRAGLIILAVLLCVAIIGVALFTKLTPEAQASIWVAIGTLALAFTTYQSITQTSKIIAAEDRRHMQQFFPYLLVKGIEYKDNALFLKIENEGIGLATTALIWCGACKMRSGEFQSGIAPLTFYPDVAVTEINAQYAGIPGGKTRLVRMVPLQRHYDKIELREVTIQYWDMFGNRYETGWADLTKDLEDYDWEQPERLRIQHQDPVLVRPPAPLK
jgi:hypothetical protein